MNSTISRGTSKTSLFLESKTLDGADPYAECKKYGGWDLELKKFVPLQFTLLITEGEYPDSSTNYALDCIALSYEAGYFTETESFLKGAFATPDDLFVFCEQLQDYRYWLNERHFYAFLGLLNCDESEMRTYEEVAGALEQSFEGR